MSIIPKSFAKFTEARILLWLLILIAGTYLLSLFWGIIAGFADIFLLLGLSFLLAFILEPLVNIFEKKKLNRITSALLVYACLTIVIILFALFLIPELLNQLSTLATTLPAYFATAPTWAAKFQDFIVNTLSNSIVIAGSIASFLFSFLLIVILSFYFLLERNRLKNLILKAVPFDYQDELLFLTRVIVRSFAGFLRVQLLMGLIGACLTAVVMLIFGARFLVSASVWAGLFSIVPVVGPFLSGLPPLLAGLLDSAPKAVAMVITLIVLQQIQYNIVAPKIMGNALKIHPAVVLLSFLVRPKIAGPWGAIFAVPIAAIIIIVSQKLFAHYANNQK